MSVATPPFAPSTATRAPSSPEPSWEIAKLFPCQGQWSEAQYLALESSRLVELSDWSIKVIEMPTTEHQDIVAFLYRALFLFVETGKLGKVSFSPLPVKLWDGTFREPDVLFMREEHRERILAQYWQGADLVMEVVSSDRTLNLEIKRSEYARSGIPEYWIVDPELEAITVLKLTGDQYEPVGVYRPGDRATSVLLAGFTVDVTAVFSVK